MTDKDAGIAGICLRGKAGWGENMAFLTALNNSFGGKWFDEAWKPQFDQPTWKESLTFYADLMKEAGPAGASSNGFNENLTLFQQGKCGMWMDATVAASMVTDPKTSTVADKVGFALFPNKEGVDNHGNWLWSPEPRDPGLVQERRGRQDLHRMGDIEGLFRACRLEARLGRRASGHPHLALRERGLSGSRALCRADARRDERRRHHQANGRSGALYRWPVRGRPGFQSIGTTVGQLFSAVIAGQSTVDDALAQAQSATEREMRRGGCGSSLPRSDRPAFPGRSLPVARRVQPWPPVRPRPSPASCGCPRSSCCSSG